MNNVHPEIAERYEQEIAQCKEVTRVIERELANSVARLEHMSGLLYGPKVSGLIAQVKQFQHAAKLNLESIRQATELLEDIKSETDLQTRAAERMANEQLADAFIKKMKIAIVVGPADPFMAIQFGGHKPKEDKKH